MTLLRFKSSLIKRAAIVSVRFNSTGKIEFTSGLNKKHGKIQLFGKEYDADEWTNITPSIIEKLDRNLLHTKNHPLYHLKNRIKSFFYTSFTNRSGTPHFSVYDSFKPVVTVEQNFDSLLTPKDHVSRSKKDNFYINKNYLLRAHTTAHDNELIRSGLNSFLTFGDVYRRDEIDSKHYPIFHQCDGARLFDKTALFHDSADLEIFDQNKSYSKRTNEKQEPYTTDACKVVELDLKNTLEKLVQFIFGKSSKLNMRWIEATFPFTHPSWELEIEYKGTWYEVLGCGILEHGILKNAGAGDYIGWAFGLGLERWSMILNDIPDIRIFWSKDSGFLSQFEYEDPTHTKIVKYKPVSVYPQCPFDVSFWLPENSSEYNANDFFDLVRDVGGDLVEQVKLIDEFENKKTRKMSHCYKIIYRSMERTLTLEEVRTVHREIEKQAVEKLGVKIR